MDAIAQGLINLEYQKCKCGGPLAPIGAYSYQCKECGIIVYTKFGKIKKYLEEHPAATAFEVSNALNISLKDINSYLREERLEVTSDSAVFPKCVVCGRDIKSGIKCLACAGKKDMTVSLVENDKPTKMRFLK